MRKGLHILLFALCLTACRHEAPRDWNHVEEAFRANAPVVIADNRLYTSQAYERRELIRQTAETYVCRLEDDRLAVNGQRLRASVTLTAQAGQRLHTAQVVLSGPYEGELWLGGGIALHDSTGNRYACDHCGIIAYAEDAPGDAAGRLFRAVVTPHGGWQDTMDGIWFSAQPYCMGDTLTYYFGAGRSEGNEDEECFPTDQEWFDAIQW